MKLDEAIKHAEEVAIDRNEAANNTPTEYSDYINSCRECAKEHEQLAEWLKQLQEVKKIVDDWHTIRDIQDAVDAMGCYFERIVDVLKD